MNANAQRITIAEACGWIKDMTWPWCGKLREQVCWRNAKGEPDDIPDYLNDLNAMHEAERDVLIKAGDRLKYINELAKVKRANWWSNFGKEAFLLCQPADQRAEAFLRTIGKWEEDK